MPSTASTFHYTYTSTATVMLYAFLAFAVCASVFTVFSAFVSPGITWLILLCSLEICLVLCYVFAFLRWLARLSLALTVSFAGLMVSVTGAVLSLVVGAIRLACQLLLACVRFVAVPWAQRAFQFGTSWIRRSADRLAQMLDMVDHVSMSIASRLSASVSVGGSMSGPNIGLRRRRRFVALVANSLTTTVVSVGSLASRFGRCTLESVDSLARLDSASFPAFSFVKRLGGGSFGTVFLARTAGHFSDLKAIKVMAKQGDTPVETLRDEVYIHSFLSRSYGGQCHPNIARLDCAKEDDASISIMMEYCSEGTLHDLYRRAPQMVASDTDVERVLLPVAHAIAHMHRHGIGHRDLKMQNILVDGHGTLKLADFGLATRDQISHEFCGTRTTMAPEVFSLINGDRACSYRPRSVDIWALGVLFWHLKFRSLPWDKADSHSSSAFRSYISNPYAFLAGQAGMTTSTGELALRLLYPDLALRANVDEAVQILQAMAK